ncbi:MAG TPA: ABC transporter permease [Vicinamibacterales bacterium]|nr:ABC transporter permease [Vicinamibacterales bacterium]
MSTSATVWNPARLAARLPALVVTESTALTRNFLRSWRVLWALTRIETRRKYAGSVLGSLWYPTYSALLLGSYCFVYLVVFKVRFKELGSYEYVLFIFAGLIPYLGFSEAVSTSTSSVRQNLTILRNAVFPIEFLPVKFVCASLFGLLSSLVILLVMVAPTSFFGAHVLYLPVAIAALFLFCVMVAWTLSAATVILPDLAYLVNIVLMLLMFVSPVGYSIDMVPARARFLVYLNPLTYLIEMFRFALLGLRSVPFWADPVFIAMCAAGAAVAGTFFRRLSPIFADYE